MFRLSKIAAIVFFSGVLAFVVFGQNRSQNLIETNDSVGSNQEKLDHEMSGDGMQNVTARKPVSSNFVSATGQPRKELVSSDKFLELLVNPRSLRANLDQIQQNWDVSYVPMLLDVGRFMPASQRLPVMRLLESKTGNRFGSDFDKWMQWNWKQKYEQHPQYANFKSTLLRRIDPRFAEYFTDTKDATIRLDEIRWGGVLRDGIPPLNNPKMLAAKQATYLADTDVVFGIELNGDARAYPKRILAWHEMFKDTIGGESICGVY